MMIEKTHDLFSQAFFWLFNNLWNYLAAFVLFMLSYFVEVSGIVNVMLFAFFTDLVVGVTKSRIVSHERFNMDKAFIAIVRFGISCLIVMILFAMDKEMEQNTIPAHKIFAYIPLGAWVISIANNGYLLTKWNVFLVIKAKIKELLNTKTSKF